MSVEGAIRALHGVSDAESSRSVRELIAAACASGGRVGMRIVTERARGHLFFEAGRIVHAEFGEDMGMRALRKMLRAELATLLPCTRRWPTERTLFLAPDKLDLHRPASSEAAAADLADPKATTGVVRRVSAEESRATESGTNYIAPPPLPDAPPLPGQRDAHASERKSSERADRAASRLPKSGDSVVSNDREPVPFRTPSTLAHRVQRARAEWQSAQPAPTPAGPSQSGWRLLHHPSQHEMEIGPASELSTEPSADAREGSPDTLPAAADADLEYTQPIGAPLGASDAGTSLLDAALRADESAASVQEPRHMSQRPSDRAAESFSYGSVSGSSLALDVSSSTAPPESTLETEITTMVRLSERGELLAARGEGAEQLADVMALIHSLSKAIAADLGRHGRVSLHASGGGRSLLVTRTETRDLAGALGPTKRLSSLLRKAGFS